MTHPFREYVLGIIFVVIATLVTWFMVSFAVFGEFPLIEHLDSGKTQYRAGNYQLSLEFDPASPQVGQNRLTIGVRDIQGMNVLDASLRVVLEVPEGVQKQDTSGSDRFLEYQAIEKSAGLFQTDVALPAEGEWPLLIEVQGHDGGHADLALNLSTGEPGIKLISATEQGQIRHTCPMHPSISQSEPGTCPLCGMALTQVSEPASGIAHYTCPMHPSIKNTSPAQCPICGMDLTPVSHEEKASGVLIVDQRRRQLIGLKTAPVERGDLRQTLRLNGEVEYNPAVLTDISLPFDGKVGWLHVVDEGTRVKAGDPLFTVSSPVLYHAERDYLRLLDLSDGETNERLEVEHQHLLSLGLNENEVAELARTRKAVAYRTKRSPADGVVIHHQLIAGQVFFAGDSLMQIAESSNMRIKAAAYENDVPHIAEGMQAKVRLAYVSSETVSGTVEHISPVLDRHDHTAEVFVDADWSGRQVLARSHADVYLEITLKDKLLIPEQAVIHSGESRVVFVDQGEGRLQPRRISTGRRNHDSIQVLEGLAEGDIVVTSGNFLLASESKLKAGIDQW
ncbi:MAG: efflux RND transporter periplasmic adaptor subunit [Gammaproteobacteria bacterium]|nr:efflux RND transporter periplasmic adaptor subunit [Gammaproteobacteria bacterium]